MQQELKYNTIYVNPYVINIFVIISKFERELVDVDCIMNDSVYFVQLTPCSTASLQMLTGLRLVKKFPIYYGTYGVHKIPAVHSYYQPNEYVHIFISYFLRVHFLRFGLPSGVFYSVFLIKILYACPSPSLHINSPSSHYS